MTERMSDEDLGRAIDEAGSSIPKDAINPATGKPFGTGNVPAMHAAMGAAARRLVHEDDALAMIERLTAERDAAMAWFRAVEKTGSALCQTFDLATPAEEALRDVLTTACSLAEFEAFRAGAEAMREALRLAAIENAEWFEARRTSHASERGAALRYFLGEIKHTPLPAHQSSTQTGTSPTTGHS